MITFLFAFMTFFKQHRKFIPILWGARVVIFLFPDHSVCEAGKRGLYYRGIHYGTAFQLQAKPRELLLGLSKLCYLLPS